MLAIALAASTANAASSCAASPQCAAALAAVLAQSDAPAPGVLEASGVSIKVDGETVAGVEHAPAGDLDRAQVDIRFDGLDVERQLAVSAVPERARSRPGEPVDFLASWNYGAWIKRAEIRIYRRMDKSPAAKHAEPVAIIPVDAARKARWVPGQPVENSGDFVYALRVFDARGAFDETYPLALNISRAEGGPVNDANTPGEGENRIQVQNIDLSGGKVSVHGTDLPAGVEAIVQEEPVALQAGGSFAAERLMPAGDHTVRVSLVEKATGKRLDFEREIHVPASEWFHVGIADLTLGRRIGADSEALSAAAPGEYEPVYTSGRVAFYLKGKVKGSTIITAAMDTRESELGKLFTNLDGTDPRDLLRRLDPDDYYPVYGDDSTIVEDAPTSGKFYLRIDKGESHVMWGNFKTKIDGVELARYERGLYGASVELRSERMAPIGEAAASITAFAAQPGTLPSRDEMRATGGSVYFLRRQDISAGSDQVSIEERDAVTGLTVSRTQLRPGADYDMDYVQGVILLKRPLASSVATNSAVQDSVLGGNRLYLVANYEYTPLAFEEEDYSFGGRAQSWLTDHLRAGVTSFQEDTGTATQTLYGADLVLQLSERSYFELEWAQSSGAAAGIVTSSDGGFIFNPVTGNARSGLSEAFRIKGVVDFADVPGVAIEGNAGFNIETREAGFNAPGRYTPNDQRIMGAFIEAGSEDSTLLTARYDVVSQSGGTSRQDGIAEAQTRINDAWSLGGGLRLSQVEGSTNRARDGGDGGRLDAGLRLTRHFSDDGKVWVFGQATLGTRQGRERNDRIGVGGEKALGEKLTANAEISHGTSGIGLLGGLSYEPTVSDRYYLGYRMTPDATGGDMQGYDPFERDYGTLVAGSNRKLTDQLSIYTEENFDFLGRQQSFTHAWGMDYAPDQAWKFGASAEAGEIYDDINGDFERIAISGSASHTQEGRSASLRLEARFEDAIGNELDDRNTFLATANWAVKVDPDWRLLAKVDAAISQSDESVILDGDYVEASAGLAYRPVENDRLNGLLRYTYLQDLPGPSQVNADDQLGGPRQRSHVISADLIYALNERVSLGGKYGIRLGEVEWNRGEGDFKPSTAQLAVARMDVRIVHDWDFMVEGRALWMSELEQVDFGLLAGVYRHVGDNLKVGVGYNFGRFSDDLTDLTLDDGGVFLNVIGQF